MDSVVVPLDSPAAADPSLVGGKASGLARLVAAGLPVPDGFAVVAGADPDDAEVAAAVGGSYTALGLGTPVAVRSSAVGEDGDDVSFAGAHDSSLDVVGIDAVLDAVRSCRGSVRSERAVAYRSALGIEGEPPMAVVVQRMVRAALAGVMFTRDPLGSDEVVVEAVRGDGRAVVDGAAAPDPEALSPPELDALRELAGRVEELFGAPQDVEWAIDEGGTVWLLQSRPITASATVRAHGPNAASPDPTPVPVLVRGLGAAPGVATGAARVLLAPEDADRLDEGEVLIAPTTSPAWVPAMVRAAAIVTDLGGITSHAAIVARELGLPCVVGAGDATVRLADGALVTVDGAAGTVRAADRPD